MIPKYPKGPLAPSIVLLGNLLGLLEHLEVKLLFGTATGRFVLLFILVITFSPSTLLAAVGDSDGLSRLQSTNLACLPGPSVPFQFISYNQCCNPFFSWGLQGAGTALYIQVTGGPGLWSPPGHQFVPLRSLLVGKDLFGSRKRPRVCRSHWGGFAGGFLGGVSHAGMSVLLPPPQSQGFSLLMCFSRIILGMFLPAAIPELAFLLPVFSLESSRKQGGFVKVKKEGNKGVKLPQSHFISSCPSRWQTAPARGCWDTPGTWESHRGWGQALPMSTFSWMSL